jgi:Leucine-rich repeat (LRR) protein
LPSNLKELICEGNYLTSLDNLPHGLKKLYCGKNQLTRLGIFSIEELRCDKSLKVLNPHPNLKMSTWY